MTAIAVGCAAAVAAFSYAGRSPGGAAPVRTFGSGAPTRLADQAAAAAPTSTDRTASTNTAPSSMSGPARTSSSTAPAASTSIPVGLTIAGTRISAPVVPVGVDAAGNMAIPERIRTIGWYRFGARPGDGAGSIVLVGHVDSAQQGEGAFFRLHTVPAGSIVTVTSADHHVFRYRVIGRQEYPKTSVPLGALFTQTGSPHLTLITCGGSFDASARSYRDNIVVTAVPVATPR